MSDDSKPPEGAKILDLRDRLPPHIFGDNHTGNLAVIVLSLFVKDDGQPYEHLAALMLVSRTLQRLMREGYKISEEEMQYIRERALEIADNTHINIDFKSTPTPEGK